MSPEDTENIQRVWDNIDQIGDVKNKKRKHLTGFFKQERVAQLARWTDNSVVSPPFNVDLKSYVVAILHCKLNICNHVLFTLLKASSRNYEAVEFRSLREVPTPPPTNLGQPTKGWQGLRAYRCLLCVLTLRAYR